MILSLAITVALLFLSSSNALFVDSSVHLARHQQIAARHPAVQRSPASGRCKAPHAAVASSTAKSPKSTAHAAVASSAAKSPRSTSAHAAVASSTAKSHISTSAPSSSKKVGLGWFEDLDDPDLENFITSKVFSIYTWSPSSPSNRHNLQFCPMLWGQDQVQEFQSVVKRGYADCVMGFNEPNLSTQSNLSPEEAAQIWMKVGDPLRSLGYSTVVTPAITSAPSGVQWFQDFFKACVNCEFTVMALHYYGTTSEGMIDYLNSIHDIFHMDIWVTEFAAEDFTGGPQANAEQISTFMKEITTWMDQTSFIKAYFPYGLATASEVNINPLDALMGSDGKPNALGCIALGC